MDFQAKRPPLIIYISGSNTFLYNILQIELIHNTLLFLDLLWIYLFSFKYKMCPYHSVTSFYGFSEHYDARNIWSKEHSVCLENNLENICNHVSICKFTTLLHFYTVGMVTLTF